jgi:hypothetical protein
MTRYPTTNDPGTAHSAKNATVPGLPSQSRNRTGRTPMVTQDLIRRASERTGFRPQLVEVPVEIIARRHVKEGHTAGQIARFLQTHLGQDHAAASLEFVSWVIGEVMGGGAR